ncbi:hypothetical protein WJX74_000539 [Apatococcus lobatus]|uniref:Uncharacterized protein n=1 Tax=Apatococcus lobatus TaxID=904363 RepID=A0AAW1RFM7_9CHLO
MSGAGNAMHKIEDMAIPKKAPGSAGKQTATDVHHDLSALGNDANKGKTGATGAAHDATSGKGGLKSAEQDVTKGKQGVTGAQHDVTKGKQDVTSAQGAAKKL